MHKDLKIKTCIPVLIVFFFFTLNAEAQCAMCRAVLESGEDQSTAEGINNGIVYLMAIPYILVGSICFYVYRVFNKPPKSSD
ncbi:hypothetical protein [uncultured Winogradskyella sp.]|uniref:hypothetical protein n=1 Tax=uncultured Winogradskyella sp. TaxID=395353 RepID=UPI0030DCABB9|tara:strand:+ start:67877 stop:68122 length:246 start_codon:yes stop_codon:yes gene_type:complete